MVKILKALLIFAIFSSALYAGDFSVNFALGYRDSITTINSNTVAIKSDINNFLLSAQLQPEEYSVGFGYDARAGKTISNLFYMHSLYVPGEGGFSDFSYIFGQDFIWKYFGLSYGLGVQVGISYSPNVKSPLWSLSPLIKLGMQIRLEPVIVSLVFGLNSRLERSWKAVPVYMADIEFVCNENSSIIISGFMREAEYLMDPWHTITAWGVFLGYKYRGNL